MDEHFERIPWAALAASERTTRWTWYIGGALLLAGLTVAVVMLVLGDAGSPAVPRLGESPVAAAVAAEVAPATATPGVSTTEAASPPIAPPAAYSEADLMAMAPGADDLRALAAAEAFVRSYFSGELEMDDVPATGREGPSGVSYVEWVKAHSVDRSDGGYIVGVALQLVVGPVGGPYVRQPNRAVAVELRDVGDGLAPVGVPRAAALDLMAERVPLPGLVDPTAIPRGAVVKAMGALAGWGTATVVGGVENPVGWTVVVEVAGRSGGHWTLQVDVPAAEG